MKDCVCCSMAKVSRLNFHFNASVLTHNIHNEWNFISFLALVIRREKKVLSRFYFWHWIWYKHVKISYAAHLNTDLWPTIFLLNFISKSCQSNAHDTYDLFAHCVVEYLLSNICDFIVFIQPDLHVRGDICVRYGSAHSIELYAQFSGFQSHSMQSISMIWCRTIHVSLSLLRLKINMQDHMNQQMQTLIGIVAMDVLCFIFLFLLSSSLLFLYGILFLPLFPL